MKKYLLSFIILLFIGVSVSEAHLSSSEIQFYVANSGNDRNQGTLQKPFATIERARIAIRESKIKDNNFIVYVRGGNYYLDKPIVFDEFDSGKDGYKVTYEAYQSEKPVVVGGKPLTNWKKVSNGVYKTKVEIGDDHFFHIFENGKRASEARYPNEGYLLGVQSIARKEVTNSALDFSARTEDLIADFTVTERSRISLWPGTDWFSAVAPITSIDKSKGIIVIGDTVHTTNINQRESRRYYLTGIKEAFDAPGEFYYDKAKKEIYYRPFSDDINHSEIILPLVPAVVRFKGGSSPVKNIVFNGIDLTISRFGSFFCETRKGTHGTNGWNEPANKEGLVYFENADSCRVENCRISNAGYNGVSMVWRALDNVLTNCEVKNCGFHAVLLSGYRAEFGSKADSNKRNIISNNHLHNCGELVGHGAGVFVWASGYNKITNNEIHDMPRYGICIKGQRWGGIFGDKSEIKIKTGELATKENKWDFLHSRNNFIAYNDIYRVSKESEDNGIISFWGCGKDNIVYNNSLHDVKERDVKGGTMAVYLDDAADYVKVENNIIYGLGVGSWIYPILAKGVHNSFINNYIICEASNQAAIRNVTQYNEEVGAHIYKRNIIYLKGSSDILSFGLLNGDKLAACDSNLIFSKTGIYNYADGNKKRSAEEWKNTFNNRYDQNSIYADPLFYNVDLHDFRLLKNSPALKMGITPIDIDKIGVQKKIN